MFQAYLFCFQKHTYKIELMKSSVSTARQSNSSSSIWAAKILKQVNIHSFSNCSVKPFTCELGKKKKKRYKNIWIRSALLTCNVEFTIFQVESTGGRPQLSATIELNTIDQVYLGKLV